jgi:hypothetical protein
MSGLILNPGLGSAGTWQNAMSFRVSTEFDSNPAMSSTNPVSIWRFIIDPGYTLMGRFGEDELKAGLGLQIERSSNKTLSYNRESPYAFVDWLHQFDKGEFNISTRYAEIATRDATIDAISRVPVNSTRASSTTSGRWSRALSERNTVAVDGAYESVYYKGGNFVDFSHQSGGVRFSHALSELSTIFLRVSGEKYLPADGGPSSRQALTTLGFDWKVENTDLTMQLGDYRNGGNNGLQGGATLLSTGQQTQLALNANRQVTSSGLGGFVKADQVSGNWSYALSENSNIGIDMQWLKNHSISINNIHTTAGVWLQRNINPLWVMRTYFLHNNIGGGVGVESASSNIIGLSFVYSDSDF